MIEWGGIYWADLGETVGSRPAKRLLEHWKRRATTRRIGEEL